MVRSRLCNACLYLKIITLLLQACAYFIAVKVRFGFNFFFSRSHPAGLPSYWGVLLLYTIVWAIAAEESGLWNIEQLYAASGKSRRLLEALAFTYICVMAAGFIYRQASYSRLVIGLSALALFVLATGVRVGFRVFFQLMRKDYRKEVKILVVGSDRFAQRVANSLLHGEVLPCRVVGFVRVGDQEVAVDGPLYNLDELSTFTNGNSINDVVIALPPARLNEVKGIAPALEKLCVPTRVVIDLGEGVIPRDRLTALEDFRCSTFAQPWRRRVRISSRSAFSMLVSPS